MASVTKQSIEDFIRELTAERDAEIASVTDEIRKNYENAFALLRRKQAKMGDSPKRDEGSHRPGPAQTNGVHRPSVTAPSRAPGERGEISDAARKFIQQSTGTFSVDDVAKAVREQGVEFKREAINAFVKRMMKANILKRTRRGSTNVKALYVVAPDLVR